MKLGGEYHLRAVGPRQWHKLAAELRLDPTRIRDRTRALAAQIPDAAATVRRRAVASGLRHPIVERLPGLLAKRASQCAALLG